MKIGAHLRDQKQPLVEAEKSGADLAQMFIGDPQTWKKPAPREDAAELRRAAIPIYVHAPYLINVCSPNNRIRIPSRKNVVTAAEAAAEIGASALIIHGGHVDEGEELSAGLERWEKAIASFAEVEVPILIENTAGGENAMVRRVDDIARLWDVIGDTGVGFVLDTCHAWAGGEPLEGIVERIMNAIGRIDLVHCNDSRDGFDSRRDRHANLGQGKIPPELLVEVVAEAGVPVVVETPGGAVEHAADIEWLRRMLAGR
jgi:deoxyribonuclease-4